MPAAWGVGSQQAPLPPLPQGDPLQRIAAATEAVARRYAVPERRYRKSLNLAAAGNSDFLDTEQTAVRMLTIQVYTGVVDIWLTDMRGGSDTGNPDFSIGVLGVPVHIPLPTMPYQITFFANGGSATGTANVWTPD